MNTVILTWAVSHGPFEQPAPIFTNAMHSLTSGCRIDQVDIFLATASSLQALAICAESAGFSMPMYRSQDVKQRGRNSKFDAVRVSFPVRRIYAVRSFSSAMRGGRHEPGGCTEPDAGRRFLPLTCTSAQLLVGGLPDQNCCFSIILLFASRRLVICLFLQAELRG